MSEQILAEGPNFPEGPAFDRRGRLWLVELKGGNLAFLENGKLTRIPVGGEPNGIAVDAQDRIVFCDAGNCSIRRHDPLSGETVTLADSLDGEPLFMPNDLAFDPSGKLGLVVTEAESGQLVSLSAPGRGATLLTH